MVQALILMRFGVLERKAANYFTSLPEKAFVRYLSKLHS